MTHDEFDKFRKRLFAAYPNIWAWVVANSPDAPETLATWERTLTHCRLDECLAIVAEWIDGKRPPPTPYEYHSTPLQIRARVMFERDKDSKRQQQQANLETYEDHQRARDRHRRTYVPLPEIGELGSMSHAVREGLAIKKRYMNGELSKAEYDAHLDEVVAKVK